MKPAILTSIRLPGTLVQRADRLVKVLAKDEEAKMRGAVTRADVLRLAMLEGLATLERKHGVSR